MRAAAAHRGRRFLAGALVAAAVLLVPLQSADAHPWLFGTNWGSSDTIGVSNVNHGTVVLLWQEGMRVRYSGLGVPSSLGDGVFGTNTKNYTVVWQSEMKALVPSLNTDGVVGSASWNAARFFFVHRTGYSGDWDYWTWSDTYGGSFLPHYVPWDGWQVTPLTCQSTAVAANVDHPSIPITWNSPSC